MIQNNNQQVNYYEIYFVKNIQNVCSLKKYDIQLTETEFYSRLSRIKPQVYKYFQHEYKEYINNDLAFQYYINTDETKIYRKQIIDIVENDSTVLFGNVVFGYKKSKLNILNFPSSKEGNQNSSFIKKLIFRVSNRIYINFEISIDSKTTDKNYNIYINYNHDDNIDLTLINKDLKNVIDLIFT